MPTVWSFLARVIEDWRLADLLFGRLAPSSLLGEFGYCKLSISEGLGFPLLNGDPLTSAISTVAITGLPVNSSSMSSYELKESHSQKVVTNSLVLG